jgi:hypothetical protein
MEHLLDEPAKFGFIDYFCEDGLHRVPVQFFDFPTGLSAWLDGVHDDNRIMIRVQPGMNTTEIGDFRDIVRKHYPDQYEELGRSPLFLKLLNENETSLIFIFRTMHMMKLYSLGTNDAMVAARQLGEKLIAEEQKAMEAMHHLFKGMDFSEPSPLVMNDAGPTIGMARV